LKKEKIVLIGLGCPDELAKACECEKPFPDSWVDGPGERRRRARKSLVSTEWIWTPGFNSGGRSSIVVSSAWMPKCLPHVFLQGMHPRGGEPGRYRRDSTANPTFHLVRALHMVGRCIDCGLCEEACPADIPLRTLYKKVAEIVSDEFGYKTGFSEEEKSPFNIIEVK